MRSRNTPSFFIEQDLPRVSLAMFKDFMSSMEVLNNPDNGKWLLRGFCVLPSEDDRNPDLQGVRESQVLFVTRSREAEEQLKRHPSSLFLVVHDGDETPLWLPRYSDRVFMVKKDRAYAYILFLVQEFFINMLFWFRRMDQIANVKGSIQDLVDASDDILENFIAVSDNTNKLLAYTRHREAPDKLSELLIETGFYTDRMVKAFGIETPLDKNVMKMITTRTNSGENVEIFILPIWGMGNYFGNCMIVCDQKPMSDGMLDYARLFIDWNAKFCSRIWKSELESKNPVDMFFINLILGNPMDKRYVEERLKSFDFPDKPQYKLVLFKNAVSKKDRQDNLTSMVAAMKKINGSKSIPFRYDGDMVVLMYADDDDDGSFSISKVSNDVTSLVCDPFDMYAGTSQVFADIYDINLAYEQASLACEYKMAIDVEHSMVQGSEQKTVYAFEDALIYYLIDSKQEQSKFRRFAFSHSFLDKVIKHDKEIGSDDFALLWVYLNCDCNISSTAKQLFMHRNTVLYHIDKIKENFNIDFSNKGTRDRCLIDFKIKFLEEGRRRSRERVPARDSTESDLPSLDS
ncbi:MAG: PucR family transcriptional regulator [Coriobacteriales bacterium]|jgi:hypothetical protein